MRSVAYSFTNSLNEKTLLDFCHSEGLTAVKMPSNDENAYIFFIADTVEALKQDIGHNVPRCLISMERQSDSYYHLNANFSAISLRTILDRVYHGDTLWNYVEGLSAGRIEKEYIMGNNISDIDRYVCLMTQDLLFRYNFYDIEKIRIGLSEMLTNAVEHGNLNITGDEKTHSTEEGTYQDLVNVRQEMPEYKDKKVRIRILSDDKYLEVEITDEGKGFDGNELPAATGKEQLLKLHGRGILITKAYFNEVVYNSAGNSVKLIRYN